MLTYTHAKDKVVWYGHISRFAFFYFLCVNNGVRGNLFVSALFYLAKDKWFHQVKEI